MMPIELFDLVMHEDPNLIFVKDENSVIRYANKAFLEIYPPERRDQVVGSTTIEDYPEAEARLFLEEDRRAIAAGSTEIVETITDYQGNVRTLITKKIGFKNADGEPYLLAIAKDVTQLANREGQLVEVNSYLQKMVAFAAHDLRSPLASFVSAIHLIKTDRDNNLSPKSARYLDLMETSATSLADHVSSVLAGAKASRGGNSDPTQNDMNLCLEEVRFNLKSLLEETNGSLHWTRVPLMDFDCRPLRQVFQNLIENSIKHRSDMPPQIVIRYEKHEGRHQIVITDNGKGIPAGDAERVFKPFEQGDPIAPGVGIGLSFCRKTIAEYDGTIHVDPGYDRGCRLVIQIPIDGRGISAFSMKAA